MEEVESTTKVGQTKIMSKIRLSVFKTVLISQIRSINQDVCLEIDFKTFMKIKINSILNE